MVKNLFPLNQPLTSWAPHFFYMTHLLDVFQIWLIRWAQSRKCMIFISSTTLVFLMKSWLSFNQSAPKDLNCMKDSYLCHKYLSSKYILYYAPTRNSYFRLQLKLFVVGNLGFHAVSQTNLCNANDNY